MAEMNTVIRKVVAPPWCIAVMIKDCIYVTGCELILNIVLCIY